MHPIIAATKEISEIAVGSVVSVNGVKFVKLNSNNQFVAVAPSICPHFATGMYMQDFTSQMCANAPTPVGTDYFPIGVLTDRRDNKKYEVRKFADGNCWMTTNLAYGGADLRSDGKDGCLKTTYCGYGYQGNGSCITSADSGASTVDVIAPGLYGDCRYSYDDVLTADVNQWGYFYNWQAAVQDVNAYHNNDYQPPQPVQGLCPDGWQLPTGGPSGQYQALAVAVGTPATGVSPFWAPGGQWKTSYSDVVLPSGNLAKRYNVVYYQTSSQNTVKRSWALGIGGEVYAVGVTDASKGSGTTIRCLKAVTP